MGNKRISVNDRKEKLSIRLPAWLLEKIKQENKSILIENALIEYLKKNSKM